jgi:hypothetical protein
MILKTLSNIKFYIVLIIFSNLIQYSTCKFGTKDISIPADIKTFSINLFTNKASIVNPQLAPKLTEKVRSKVINQTRLRPQANGGHYEISGYINSYTISTSGIANGQSSNNRVTASFHIIVKDNVVDKRSFEADVSKSFEYSANQNLRDAEIANLDVLVNNLGDEIFNKIFSNW